MYKHELTIPGYIHTIESDDKEPLMKMFRLFGSSRRRMYNMKWKNGLTRDMMVHNLSDTELNTRYLRDAYYTIENLPVHVTFGGIKNQRLRENGKLSKDEWEECRNAIILSRGDKSKSGNLNLRIVEDGSSLKLRVNLPFKDDKYAYLGLYIPNKYLDKYGSYLKGDNPYTVTLKRKAGKLLAKISIVVPVEIKHSTRTLAIDTNAGHLDFAVMDKNTDRLLATGKVNTGNKDVNIIGKKVSNIASHYDADVVIGKLNTKKFRGNKKANRKVHTIPHYKLKHPLKKYLAEKNRKFSVMSEAYTTKVGTNFVKPLGLDIHKCSAIAFAVKVINYDKFLNLRGVSRYEGSGSQTTIRDARCEITSLCQGDLAYDNAMNNSGGYAQTPGMGGIDTFVSMIKGNLRNLQVLKIP